MTMEHSGPTLLDYFQVISRSKPTENLRFSPKKSRERPVNYFDGCITIDDDEEDQHTQPIQNSISPLETMTMFSHPISTDISTREKLLDHAVHSPTYAY